MRILLIFPPSTIYGNDPSMPSITPPIGLAYLAAYLEREGYEVNILDTIAEGKGRKFFQKDRLTYGISDEEILAKMVSFKPQLIGIACMYTAYAGDAYRVAKIAKQYNRDIPVIFGGAHSSLFPKQVLKDINIDAVVVGEGEQTLLELVKCVEKGKDFSEVTGIIYRNNSEVSTNAPRKQIEDLDSLPFPAWHLLDMNLYLGLTLKSKFVLRSPSLTMISSRGCPQHCVYCTIHSVWGNIWRGRSPQNVVDEIQYLMQRYGIKEVSFMDDSMGCVPKRLAEICQEITDRRLDIKWTTPNGIAHWTLNKELLRKMKKAGCYRITFGIESGNIQTRKFLGKPFDLKQAKELIRFANRIGMWTICTFIIGFPYEDKSSIDDTIQFAIDSDTDFAVFYLLCPHPGTKVYEFFKNEGLLDFDRFTDPLSVIPPDELACLGESLAGRGARTKYFSVAQLQDQLNTSFRLFFRARIKSFLNPVRIIRKINSLEDLFFAYKLGFSMLKPLIRLIASGRFSSQMIYKKIDNASKKKGQS